MITGDLKSKVDRVWDAFWSGGIANPIEVIEQITYLLFLRRLDELQTLAENKANRTGQPLDRIIFDGGANDPASMSVLGEACWRSGFIAATGSSLTPAAGQHRQSARSALRPR